MDPIIAKCLSVSTTILQNCKIAITVPVMKTSLQVFQDEIEDFLARFQIDATRFGRGAMNDPAFVFRVRAGRAPSLKTVDRVREWMRGRAAEIEAA